MADLINKYYSEQIITYIGNKRSFLKEIDNLVISVCKELNKEKIISADLFSGCGIVARLLKSHSSLVIANDLEHYSKILNECFLSNESDFDREGFNKTLKLILKHCNEKPFDGIISNNYAPKDDKDIKLGERVFYTHENASFIDSFRYYIDKYSPEKLKNYYLALLITEASIHVNTSGVFKGFYKDKNTGIGKFGGTSADALKRITGKIKIDAPYFCESKSDYKIYQEDTTDLSSKLSEIDLVYLDPPYNQHPYGSNYFMLNLIASNIMPQKISKISGISSNWNHSQFNKKDDALSSLKIIIKNLKAKYILISYNNEGFISYDDMVNMLKKYGKLTIKEIEYNTFRGGRNLRERNIHTKEFLFLLKKEN